MSNDDKSSLKANYSQYSDNQPRKRKLLAKIVKFIAWVIVIGLLIAPLACTVQISDDTNKQQGGDDE